MLNKYYQDELTFLREMGKEFSQTWPDLAHMLAERGSDPDVERLLEGFAFLAARIRQKLDDEFPEVTHGLWNLLWPHYLRPIPSTSVLEFKSVPGAVRDKVHIPRGTGIASIPVEGTRCRFRTCYGVDLYPMELTDAGIEEKAGAPLTLRIGFQVADGVQLKQMGMDSLRLFLWGEPEITSLLYLWICRNLKEITFQGYLEGRPSQQFTIPSSSVTPAGFTDEEALLPSPSVSFTGFRLLQEYFALPAKFMFLDIRGLRPAAELEAGGKFELHFRFNAGLQKVPKVTKDNFRLFCTPIINLFAHTADPFRLEHDRVEYRLRPASVEAKHYEIYSVEKVVGWEQGQTHPREYASFYDFKHDLGSEQQPIFYQMRLRPSISGVGSETFVSFVSEQQERLLPPAETVSIDLICTNRNLTDQLRIKDVSEATGDSPEFATFQNITRVTSSIRPPLDEGLHWRLLSHLALNYLSLVDVTSLRAVLQLYNFQALYDRQAARANQLRLDAIQSVRSKPMDWLLKGVPVRGISIELDLVETNFSGEGDLYLFATILNELFALYTSMNSFTRLTVRGVKEGEVYQWAPRLGHQILA
jgi:type VI secretion system protein ImpG